MNYNLQTKRQFAQFLQENHVRKQYLYNIRRKLVTQNRNDIGHLINPIQDIQFKAILIIAAFSWWGDGQVDGKTWSQLHKKWINLIG